MIEPIPSLPPPSTPRKHAERKVATLRIKMILDDLTRSWDLRLELPPADESPSARIERGHTSESKCVQLIKRLSYKKLHGIPIAKFNEHAERLWSGWKYKPNGDKDVIPRATQDRERRVLTKSERKIMIELLLRELEVSGDELTEASRTPRHLRRPSTGRSPFRDDPIEFPFSSSVSEGKRAREEPVNDAESLSKKCRSTPLAKADSNAMLPPERGRPSFKGTTGYRSANTSFGSTVASVFSANDSFGYEKLPNTQETIPDLGEQSFEKAGNQGEEDQRIDDQRAEDWAIAVSNQSSDYGAASSFEAALNNAIDVNALILGTHISTERVEAGLSSQLEDIGLQSFKGITAEDMLQERLGSVFPKLPLSLEKAPVHVIYEITRVFAHVGVSMSEVEFRDRDISKFSDYNFLWKFLQRLPVLEGKVFPDKSHPHAWEAANSNYTYRGEGVVFGGSLKFNNSKEPGPFFQFRLKPLSLDRRVRLGRKLGEDRFLKLDMPDLQGNDIPKSIRGSQGQEVLFDWLVNDAHWLFGRSWTPFSHKHKESNDKQEKQEKRKEKQENKHNLEETAHSVYFFAKRGNGLSHAPQSQEDEDFRPNLTIAKMQSDYIRLTRRNTAEPYLKLFSRTTLALSRNIPTVVFERSQIKNKKDIKINGKEMTDGAGQISPAAASKVRDCLGLDYLPSGFQGRIGEAKGFWTVDYTDISENIWIKVYASQRKWKRTPSRNPDHPDNDINNRTFEVLRTSGPLKSAGLNFQFLPLLVEQAKDKNEMRNSLRNLLELGLQTELDNLLASSENAQELRKWIGPNSQARIKSGKVQFEAGLPKLPSEILIMLLDAGFETKKLNYAMELCKKMFRSKCDELKDRLNITVGKSTYAYMVPDFWGVLAEDEVYMNCPNFTDAIHGTTGDTLYGRDVLVARSPAHFVSDIQKVKLVAKAELMGLRDVIVFPTTGFPSLADKLSGGDYDGDLGWVCWEPSIVDNYEAAPMPAMPDLVAEGFIKKDNTSYKDLVEGQDAPDSYFLKKAFQFNMQPKMLGKCTVWKERLCYNLGTLAAPEATKASVLLSCLVDASKQGYIFTEDDWKRFKKHLLDSVRTRIPGFRMLTQQHKEENPRLSENSEHIIDYLLWVAKAKVEKSLEEFEKSLDPKTPHWDEDLVAFARWAEQRKNDELAARKKNDRTAKESYGWIEILDDLKTDLDDLKTAYREEQDHRKMSKEKGKDKEDLESISAMILRFHERYLNILPHQQNDVTETLRAGEIYGNLEFSEWALLRASVLFMSHAHNKRKVSNLTWQMAGKQLAHLKALRNGNGGPHSVVPGMYVVLKPNGSMIKRFTSKSLGLVGGAGEEGESDDGEEDEL